MTDQIEVTQADRDAAADMFDELSSLIDHVGIGQVGDLIRDGEFDGHMGCEAFARHRIAERDKLAGELKVMTDIQREARLVATDMRLDAAAFRAHDVYDSEGDPVRLLANADRCARAANCVDKLAGKLAEAVKFIRGIDRQWIELETNGSDYDKGCEDTLADLAKKARAFLSRHERTNDEQG